MRHLILVLGFFLFVLSASGQTDSLLQSWKEAINEGQIENYVKKYYDSTAYTSFDQQYEAGDENIVKQISSFRDKAVKIMGIKLLNSTIGRNGQIMALASIGTNHGMYIAMTSWVKKGNEYLRILDIVRPTNFQGAEVANQIEIQRRKWVNYSNNQDPTGLINDLCTEDVRYINCGNMIKGQAALIEEYQYMTGDNWSIQLTMKELVQVDETTFFEIGTYKSNGQGQYLLIWNKVLPNNKWKISLDSNF